MISIRQSLSELDKAHRVQEALVETYRGSILSVAQYAVDVDPKLTPAHREHLTSLAAALRPDAADPAYYDEVRAALRNELRDYRDRSAKCLSDLREDLVAKAASLTQIFEAMSASDGDHETRIARTLATLRAIAADPRSLPIRKDLQAATEAVAQSIEELKRQNQVTVAQFLVEVRMLHNRIETLQTAATEDAATRLSSRSQMESTLGKAVAGGQPFALLLLKTRNLRPLQRQFGEPLVETLLASFSKRLRNCLRPEDPTGRWGEDQFLVILTETRSGSRALARRVAEHTSGVYVCMDEGKPLRPALQVDVGVVETRAGDPLDRVLHRVEEFFRV